MTDILDQFRTATQNQPTVTTEPCTRQHNDLVQSCYAMTLIEKQILALAMSKIYSEGGVHMGDAPTFILRADEFKRIYGVTHHSIYNDLKKAASQLGKRQVTVKDTLTGKDIGWFNWMDSCQYWDDEHAMKLRFSVTANDYLHLMKDNYTETALLEIADFKSFHTVRIYELISQYKDTGKKILTVDQLRKILQLQEKYPDFRKLLQRVINPAIEAINKEHSLNLKITVEKKGRSPHLLTFTFKRFGAAAKLTQDRPKTGNASRLKPAFNSTRHQSIADDLADHSWAPSDLKH